MSSKGGRPFLRRGFRDRQREDCRQREGGGLREDGRFRERGRLFAAPPLLSLLSIVLGLLLWGFIAYFLNTPIVLPSPAAVFKSLVLLFKSPEFWPTLGATSLRVALALLISVPLATLVGSASAFWPRFYDILRPFFSLISATPVLSIILIAFFIFGQEGTPLFTAFLLVFPIVSFAAMGGIKDRDSGLAEVAKVYKLSLRLRIRWLLIPALLPRIISALQAGLAMAWKVVVAAEVLVQPMRSLGRGMYTAKMRLESSELFAWTLVTVSLAALTEAFIPLSRRLFRNFQQKKILKQEKKLSFGWQGDILPNLEKTSLSSLNLKNISFSYIQGEPIFKDFSFTAEAGERIAILGPSASGKTTLLSLLAGLRLPENGEVLAPKASMVFQEPRLFPTMSVLENVALVRYDSHRDCANRKERAKARREAQKLAGEMLGRVGLDGRFSALPAELSGGQRQRVALARAFMHSAPLLLMDEAFQSLDLPLRILLMDLSLELLSLYPRTLIAVTHDPREAIYIADRILVLGSEGAGFIHEEKVGLGRAERAFSSPAAAEIEARLFAALGGSSPAESAPF